MKNIHTSSNTSNSILEKFQDAIGVEYVISQKEKRLQAETATFFTQQKVTGILYPKNQEEIQNCLKIANEYEVKIYPISSGKNWGYGSRVPTADKSFILSLKRMNQILEYDEKLGVVQIQAGVTFAQLYDFLKQSNSKLILSSPGSTLEASVVGNTLERGVAQTIDEERTKRVIDLEAILPTGEIIQTGMRGFSNSKAYHPFGLGADLKGLFFQSNFGIVTLMTLSLPRLPKYRHQCYFAFSENDWTKKMIPLFQQYISKKIFPQNISIYNRKRIAGTLEIEAANISEKYDWYATTVIYGESMQEISAKEQLLNDAFGKGNIKFSLGKLNAPSPFFGQPSTNSLKLAYLKKKKKEGWKNNPDLDACGLIWMSPVVPFLSEPIKKCLEIINNTLTDFSFEKLISIQTINEKYVYLIVPILYDRLEHGADEKAMDCHEVLLKKLTENGFYPYRLSHLDQGKIEGMRPANLELLQRLKKVFDPNDILAPNRYDFRNQWKKESR